MDKKHYGLSSIGMLFIIILVIISTTVTRWLVMETSDRKIRELEGRLISLQDYSQQLEAQLSEIKQQVQSMNLQLGLLDNTDATHPLSQNTNTVDLNNDS